jgi:hypothetical protein
MAPPFWNVVGGDKRAVSGARGAGGTTDAIGHSQIRHIYKTKLHSYVFNYLSRRNIFNRVENTSI